jgi:predicted transcriptional regulator
MQLERKVNPTSALTRRVLDEKWGKAVIDCGYAAMPTVLLKNQQTLKLKPLDINVLLHLLSYWWLPENLPRPGKKALAVAINVDPSTIRRCLQKLEKMGYVGRLSRRTTSGGNRPNAYDFSGLVKVLQPLAAEEQEEIRKRKARALTRLAGKKPGLQLVKK